MSALRLKLDQDSVHTLSEEFVQKLSFTSTIRTHRSHQSVTRTELYANAFQIGIWKVLIKPTFNFRVDGKHWKRSFSKTMASRRSRWPWFPWTCFSSDLNPQWLHGGFYVVKFLPRGVYGKHLMRVFRVRTLLSNSSCVYTVDWAQVETIVSQTEYPKYHTNDTIIMVVFVVGHTVYLDRLG